MLNQVSRLWQGYFDSFDSPLTGGVAGGGVLVIIHAHPTEQAEGVKSLTFQMALLTKKVLVSTYIYMLITHSILIPPL